MRKILMLTALLALVILGLPSFATEPPATPAQAALLVPGSTALLCPNHPPGFCCSGPPLCRCTRGPCS